MMYNAFIETEGEPFVTKTYGPSNQDLQASDLTDVFVVCYTVKCKGQPEPMEMYSFTTDFDQAYKRFKLLPNTKAYLKRFMTDDDELIRLATEGTKAKYEEGQDEGIDLKELLDTYRDEDDEGKPIYQTTIDTQTREPSEFDIPPTAPSSPAAEAE